MAPFHMAQMPWPHSLHSFIHFHCHTQPTRLHSYLPLAPSPLHSYNNPSSLVLIRKVLEAKCSQEREPSLSGFDPSTSPSTVQHSVSAPPRQDEEMSSILDQTAVLPPGGQVDSQSFVVLQKYEFLPQAQDALLLMRSCTLQRVACHRRRKTQGQ